jgi:hypothetical protein
MGIDSEQASVVGFLIDSELAIVGFPNDSEKELTPTSPNVAYDRCKAFFTTLLF